MLDLIALAVSGQLTLNHVPINIAHAAPIPEHAPIIKSVAQTISETDEIEAHELTIACADTDSFALSIDDLSD